ncbi:MAG: hypothetical protein C0514_03665 [Candidatus Puniceispirillum sp.]|nr:hypothetical protein [Candidatus Puniceispirillum sp.]
MTFGHTAIYGTSGVEEEERLHLRNYQRTILGYIDPSLKKSICDNILSAVATDRGTHASPARVSVAFSVEDATNVTLAHTPEDADLKVLFVDLDETLFFEGAGRFWKTRFLQDRNLVEKAVSQSGYGRFEELARQKGKTFKIPALETSELNNISRLLGSPHVDHFKNPLFFETRETMEDGIQNHLTRLREAGYQIVGLTNRPYAQANILYTRKCLEDAGISFERSHCFSRDGIEFQAGRDGFTFSLGVIYCDNRNKARQASLFLAQNLILGHITPAQKLHLALWDDQRRIVTDFLEDKAYASFRIGEKVSKHSVCMGLESLLTQSLEDKTWDLQTAVDFLSRSSF